MSKTFILERPYFYDSDEIDLYTEEFEYTPDFLELKEALSDVLWENYFSEFSHLFTDKKTLDNFKQSLLCIFYDMDVFDQAVDFYEEDLQKIFQEEQEKL